MPGAPCIYYGDEIGMEGGKDPDCRRAFPWDQLKARKALPIYKFIRELTRMRRENPVLRDGKVQIESNGAGFTVTRTLGRQKMTLAVTLTGSEPEFKIK
jgi:glycosidase